jgi:hypothetical protein
MQRHPLVAQVEERGHVDDHGVFLGRHSQVEALMLRAASARDRVDCGDGALERVGPRGIVHVLVLPSPGAVLGVCLGKTSEKDEKGESIPNEAGVA